MTSVPGPAFRDHLAELDRETATAFVAAVYDARGWTVSSGDEDGDVALLATPPQSDHTRRLVVCVGGTADCDGEAGIDRTVVDAATLYELLAYALDPSNRHRLCRTFFDREFEAIGAPPAAAEPSDRDDSAGTASPEPTVAGAAGSARDAGTTDTDPSAAADAGDAAETAEQTAGPDGDESENAVAEADAEGSAATAASTTRQERLVRAAGVVVALSLIFGGIVTAAGPALTESAATAFGGDEPASDDGSAAGNQSVDVDAPPGLDVDGVGHAGRLADAHEAALGNRSFRLHIVHREFADGELRGVATERAVVTASGRYRSETQRLGQVDYASEVIGDGATYSNGVRRYVRSHDVGDAAGESPRLQLRTTMTAADPNRVVDRTERYVQWYLSVESSRLAGTVERDGTTLYVLDFERDPWSGATDVSGRALVSETGVVREIRRSYVPRSDQSVRVETVIRITPGPVEVTRPGWVPPREPRHRGIDEGSAPARAAPTEPDARPAERRA
ncbi:hypothetical protein [Haloplanus rubicundus]|uniref:hypothetical protein n=1 Tax=Haloplanus rubicundus TaxID=1547898 RepID=UPI00130088D9|nr:hypothetical protein [Haloplanus rubicundus]